MLKEDMFYNSCEFSVVSYNVNGKEGQSMGMDCGVKFIYLFVFFCTFFFPPPFLLGVEGSNVRQGLDREKLERNGANGPSYPNGEK